jgi:hypothetical protein
LSTLWKGAPRQRRRRQLLLLITVYEGEQGQKTYAINEGEPMHGASLLVGCVDVRVLALSGTQKATGIFRGADFGEANLLGQRLKALSYWTAYGTPEGMP